MKSHISLQCKIIRQFTVINQVLPCCITVEAVALYINNAGWLNMMS